MKKNDFLAKSYFFNQKSAFFHFLGPIEMGKRQKSKKWLHNIFFNYPKEHYYQLLDQSDNFPRTSSDFTAKSGGHVRSEKRAKNAVFR